MKFKYYVGVLSGNDIRYVTQVDRATMSATWEDGATAVSMSQSAALELVFGLRCNGFGAVVITAPDYERFVNSAREDWFGVTRWCDEDIHKALVENGYEPTEEAIALIRRDCEHHCFRDATNETGWHYIHSYISEHASELTPCEDGEGADPVE